MTPEIKKRIEQIKSGKIPKGYKRTRAGIMPCDWCIQKEYKAKDVFCSVSNKNHNGDYEVLSATQDRGVIPRSQVDIDIKYDETNTDGYKKVDKGDFVISLRSFQGGIEYSEYTGLVSPAYTVLKPKVPICDGYYKSYFKTNDFISRLSKGTYGIRDGKQVGFKDFGEMIIHFPPLPEQEKIAKILSTQDKVIECYEKKIEQLKQIKKYYLQNMFPKRGETVPKIRFKGFTDPWEQRKLGEVFVEYSEKGHAELQPLTIIQGKGTILREESERKLIYDQSGLKGYKLVNQDDFILHLRSFEGGFEMANSQGIVSPAYHIFHGENTDTRFYYPFFRSKYFISVLLKPHVYGIRDGKSIDIKGMKSIYIPYPSIEEQNKIGSFFLELDTLITLHQRKLEEEKKKKKALQQLLLTGIVRTN